MLLKPSTTIIKNGESSTAPTQVLDHPELSVSHLPPLSVNLHLPETYPLEFPPKVASIRADISPEDSLNWLPRSTLVSVERQLKRFWEDDKAMSGEGSGVLWRFWEYIGNGEFLVDQGVLRGDTLRYVLMLSYWNWAP